MFLVEDYDFWMRASERFHFAHLNEILYEIRYHGASLTNNNYAKTRFLSEDAFDRDFPGMQKWLSKPWKIRGHLRLIATGLSQKKWGRVMKHSVSAFATAPVLTLKEMALKLNRGLQKRGAAQTRKQGL